MDWDGCAINFWIWGGMDMDPTFFYKSSPNLLNGRFDETRARSKQSL